MNSVSASFWGKEVVLLQWYWWLQTHSWEWQTLKAPATTHSTKNKSKNKNISKWKLLKGVLKIVTKMKCNSSQLVSSGGGEWERTRFSLRGWSLKVCPYSSEYMGNTTWTWCIYVSFLWVGSKGGRMDMGRMEVSVIWVLCMKFSINQ